VDNEGFSKHVFPEESVMFEPGDLVRWEIKGGNHFVDMSNNVSSGVYELYIENGDELFMLVLSSYENHRYTDQIITFLLVPGYGVLHTYSQHNGTRTSLEKLVKVF
jgi:hypothetical protein